MTNRLLIAMICAAASTSALAHGADLFAPSAAIGREQDAQRALPLTSFYQSPHPLTPADPGTLVRSEPAEGYALPSGVRATRILYHTRTFDNKDVLSSGVVMVPYGTPPANGWPLIAWSHGTSGVARACAPSLMKTLFYNWEGLFEYVMLGYAVVATDYAGLGTEGRHAYLDMASNGTDVINSVRAAHAAVPALSRSWVVVGHSQGGLSSLGVAQLESAVEDPDFLGAVSIAGASDVEDAFGAMMRARMPVLNGLVAFWIFGARSVDPQLDPRSVLSEEAFALYGKSVENGCSAASGAFAALPPEEMLRPGWSQNEHLRKFLDRNRPGIQPVRGPVLLLGGGDDVLFTDAASEKVFRRFCRAGVAVQRNVYPGLGHDPLVYGSLRDQIAWIAARFAGEPAPSNCPKASVN